MDKEAFLHQLESSAVNKDKKEFIKSIFDLPANVIVGFTKEEFLRVISLSRSINLQQVDELFYFLEDEGQFFLEKAFEGNDELNNSQISRFYYSLFISLAGNNKQRIKSALVNNAVACCNLAEMGVESRENLEIAIKLYRDAREIFSKTSASYARALVNEGSARRELAEMGINSKENLETAVFLCGNGREIFPKTSEEYGLTLVNEIIARLRLAEIDVNSRENLETSVRLCNNAREIFPKTSTYYTSALIKEFYARLKLAEMCIDSKENLEISVCLCGTAQNIFSKTSEDYAQCLEAECVARAVCHNFCKIVSIPFSSCFLITVPLLNTYFL